MYMINKVLVCDPISEEGLSILSAEQTIRVDVKPNLSEAELVQIISEYDALIVRSQTQVTKNMIEPADRLKVIGRAGVGVDNIDLAAATLKGIIVINSPDGNTISTAEHTFSMLMSLARKIPQAYYQLKNHVWDRKSFVGVELNKKVLGIIGLGRIGTEVAKRAKAFNMQVIAYDPFLTPERAAKLGIDCVSFDEVLSVSDFITVHTPLMKETKHLINAEAFRKMKDGVYILNCARGGIVDEEALYAALESRKVAGAALDVFEEEPATHHRLLELNHVIATPHLGASTAEAQKNVAIDVCHQIVHVLKNEPFLNAVNLPSLPAHLLERVEPYLQLGDKLGSFAIQLSKGVLKQINVKYSGELIELDTSPVTRTIIKGILAPYLGEHINDVNAPYLARLRDIAVNEGKTSLSHGFTNLISITLESTEGRTNVAGTSLEGYGSRVVKVGKHAIDVKLEGHIIYIRHHDKPGVIGRVGTLLGQYEVNIATMQVGRSNKGGEAIMILRVDKPLTRELQMEICKLMDIAEIIEIEL